MRKLTSLMMLLLSFLTVQTFAQLTGSGFYRVHNRATGRYIAVHDDKGSVTRSGSTIKADMGAMEMMSSLSDVLTDPGSVIYFNHLSGGVMYNLRTQGIKSEDLMRGYNLRIGALPDNVYLASVDAGAGAAFLADDISKGLTIGSGFTDPNSQWYITPINNSGDNYFAVKPEFSAGGKYYTTLYTSYAYQLSSGMKAYYVSGFDSENRAVLKEILGKVPAETAVILQCSSNSVAANKLVPISETVPAVGTNYLKGVYFNINKVSGGYQHTNQTPYNAATMRVIGASGGKASMVKSSDTYLAANKAYLSLPSGKTFGNVVELYFPEDDEPTITVTANDAIMIYGDAVPTFTYTVTGGTLDGKPTLSCDATSSSRVGDYTIKISKGTIKNSKVVLVNGLLKIKKAQLSVIAGNYEKKQGEPNPEFHITYDGLKQYGDENFFSPEPQITCDATIDSPEGVYPVKVSGGVHPNYELKYVNGTLTILPPDKPKEEVTLTANSYTITYGDDIPKFEYTRTGTVELGGEPQITCSATADSPAGTYDIIINKGTCTYDNIVLVNGKLTIKKAMLTAKADDKEMKQGDPMPALTVSLTGFVKGEKESVLTKAPTASTAATSDSEPGTYDINVAGAEAQNYDFTYVKGVLTVKQADPITVTANSYTIKYGDELPAFAYTVEGGELKGVPTISCVATEKSPAGTYDIVIAKGTVSNYNVTFVNGTLTIEKALLTVTADDKQMKQGDNMPTLTVSYAGFVHGENVSALSKKPVPTTTANSNSEPGTYEITVAGGEAKNYEFNYVSGTLTIAEPDAIIITANNQASVYGDYIPELTYTVEGGTLKGKPVITCEATRKSPVGTYDIVLSMGTVTNPKVTLVNGKLEIEKAILTVKTRDYERDYGKENPYFMLMFSGFKNGETKDVLIEQPVATCEATPESPSGTYPIVISGGKADNYDFNYVNATLTVLEDTGIDEVFMAGKAYNVYTTTGVCVRTNATTLKGLTPGLYIVNGKKVAIR